MMPETTKNVLLVGGGGREHALAWKILQSPKLGTLFVAPGNGGTTSIAKNVDIRATDIDTLLRFAIQEHIDLAIVGPDDPLALGIVDRFTEAGIPIFGPTKAAAEIEASKAFAKEFMRTNNIPTADFAVFRNHEDAVSYVRTKGAPIVVKASGLALGKGVTVCRTTDEAEAALSKIFIDRVFGDAGNEVVIEEFLEGQEVSAHAVSDGKTFVIFPSAQDHKPVFDGNRGPNTGGMGTIAPVPWVTADMMHDIETNVVAPVLSNMKKAGRQFSGLLYPGFKMTPAGPKVLEFNARFGDPETQSYMRLLKSDLLEILAAAAEGRLESQTVEWHPGFAVCIVMASGGYPGKYEKGKRIEGITDAEKIPGVVVFHAGTTQKDGVLTSSGGRVLGVSATAHTLREALDRAYEGAARITFDGMHYRKDIGAKAFR